MEVSKITKFNYPHYLNEQNSLKRYSNNAVTKDSFTRSPSFKQNPYEKILKDPNLLKMAMTAVGTAVLGAFASLVDGSGLKPEDIKIPTDFGNIFGNIINKTDSAEKSEENKVSNPSAQEIKTNEENKTQTVSDSINKTQKEEKLSTTDSKTLVKFPPRRGNMIEQNKALRTAVGNGIELTKSGEEKFQKILTAIFLKNPNYDAITGSFAKDLAESSNKEAVVNEYYTEKYKLDETTNTQTPTDVQKEDNTNDGNNIDNADEDADKSTASEEQEVGMVYHTDVPVLTGPKILGTLDLNTIHGTNRKKPRISNSKKADNTTEAVEATSTPASNQHTAKSNTVEEVYLPKNTDGSVNEFEFQLPRTVKYNNIGEYMNAIYRYFVCAVYRNYKNEVEQGNNAEKPMWNFNPCVGVKADRHAVKREIKNPKHCYSQNIKSQPIDVIVDIINSDPRFGEYFTVHSACRVLDRFVNFDDDEDPEVQCKKVLDKIESFIIKACKDGTTIKKHDGNEKWDDYCAPCIVIDHKLFNKEERNIFGTVDLIIAFCEKQEGKKYNPKNNSEKEALICTIFSSNI